MVIAFFPQVKRIWSDCIHLLGKYAYRQEAYDSFSAFLCIICGSRRGHRSFREEKGNWSAGLH